MIWGSCSTKIQGQTFSDPWVERNYNFLTSATGLQKTLRTTSTLGENKQGDPIFLLQFLNVLYMADICAKFEKTLDGISFSSELP